jgi:hypothetical protein
MTSTIYFGWDREESEQVLKLLIPNESADITRLFSPIRERLFSEPQVVKKITSFLEVLSSELNLRLRLFRFDSGIYLNSSNYYLTLSPRFINEVHNRDEVPELKLSMDVFDDYQSQWLILKKYNNQIMVPSIMNLITGND